MTDLQKYPHANPERLAQMIHEAQREAVAQGKTLTRALGSPPYPFIEWGDLPEQAKEGRRMIARYLIGLYHIIPKLEGEDDDTEAVTSPSAEVNS